MTQNLRIAIVGGGPGGLTLARILQTRGIAATVFEQESSSTARWQGGSLDLHSESGLFALHLAGLDAAFRAVARYEDQNARWIDKSGTPFFEMTHEPGEGNRPEIDRAELRTMLLRSLDPGVVQWGRSVRSIQPLGDGTHNLYLPMAKHKHSIWLLVPTALGRVFVRSCRVLNRTILALHSLKAVLPRQIRGIPRLLGSLGMAKCLH